MDTTKIETKPQPIPLFSPQICGNEWKYVKDCLDTTWVSSVGAYVERFERLVAERAGVNYAVATVNGTAALHMALAAAGVRRDDEVLVSTLTFIASANAVRYVGAWPVFIDAEPRHWQMDPGLVESFLSRNCVRTGDDLMNRRSGRRVSGIMPVHVLGHPVDLDPLLQLGKQFGLPIIEDAAEALGVRYKGHPVGGRGTVGAVSFNGNKLITTGGGGMALTNNRQLAENLRHWTTQAKVDPLEYIHDEVGYNYRMSNVLAAIGCAQIEQLDEFIAAKRKQAAMYATALSDVPGITLFEPSADAFCTFWMNTIRVNREAFGMDSRQLLRALHERGIQTRGLWQPMHRSPAHKDNEAVLSGVADSLYAECLNIPSSVGMTMEQVNSVCEAIRDIGRHALRGRTAA